MGTHLTTEDEGKKLLTPDGEIIGTVDHIHAGDAHVRVKEGLLVGCGSWVSGPWNEDETFVLDPTRIRTMTETAIVLEEPPQITSV